MDKPPRTFWQIWNISFGFLGIQFGWGLQMANMSAIYEQIQGPTLLIQTSKGSPVCNSRMTVGQCWRFEGQSVPRPR